MDATGHLHAARAAAAIGAWGEARGEYAAAAQAGTAEALEGLARTCWWLGDVRAAVQHGERAFTLHQQEGCPEKATMIAVDLCIWYLTNLDNHAAGAGWLARATRCSVDTEDATALGWIVLLNGLLSGSGDELCASAEDARRLAQSVDDAPLDIMALSDHGLALVVAGQVPEGMRLLDESMAGLGTLDQRREVVVWASCNMLAACALVDDIERAAQWCRAADEFMATHGCPFLQARCRAHYGQVLLASGDWARAETELLRALAMAEDVGRGPRLEALAALADLRTRQGRPDEALRLLADLSPTITLGVVAEARAHLALGQPSDAVATLRAQLAVLAPGRPDLALVRALLVEAYLAAGRLTSAADLLGADAEQESALAHPRPRALLVRAAGLVAHARGDDGAVSLLTAALERFDASNLPYEAARTRLDLAVVLADGDPDAAIGQALRALTAFRGLGASGAEGEVTALLRRLGCTPGPAPREAGTLTRREREVLQLVAAGLSNPQIAERLFLSRKTVAHHVSHILAKLGTASRTEAAAYALRHGDL